MEGESMAARGSHSKPTTVKLLCPALSKIVPYAAWEEQRLDLGSIARALGLEPRTLKLNGHLIGRGADLMSSVTWRSLLNYFSGKGLPTGKTDRDALVVDGRLCKVGSKRGKPDAEIDNGGIAGAAQTEETNLVKRKKLKESSSAGGQGIGWSRHALKRKQGGTDDIDMIKKLKINESSPPPDIGPRKNQNCQGSVPPAITSSSRSKCRYVKRKREDDVLIASPCKKIHRMPFVSS